MNSFLKYLLFIIYLFPATTFANDPCTAIGVPNNSVLFTTYSLSGQSASGVEPPPCGTYNDPDMWFSFTAPAGGSVTIEVKGITASDPAMAIYSGSCGALTLEGCYDDQECGNNPNPGVSLNNLTVGSTYYIRVWNEVAGAGQFKLRIINLNQSNFTNQFNAFNTAPNCVQLTAAANTQKGCSWYNAPLDFDEAFELEFDLFFGSNDAGADGICLVFSNNQNCGDTGGGIGASGIPNSIIVEFDTYDNGMVGFDDIPEDHTSIHINGDFTSSIAGPFGLGNIEDGQSHPARIVWDPNTLNLTVFLDGAQVLQLNNYDAVNNVFGGENEIYWGWTASTGGANNQQSFCFETAIDNTAPINETVDLLLCSGETYTSPNGNTYNTEGEYLENFMASNGCSSMRTINIDLIPVPFKLIEKIICSNESYLLNGTTYSDAGNYMLTLPGIPCDTLANLTIAKVDFDILISKSNDIDCLNGIATLQATLIDNSTNPFGGNFDYYWTSAGGNILSGQGTNQIIVDQPGIYQVLVYALDNLVNCSFTSPPAEIIDNTAPPTAIIAQQGMLDCINTQAILDGSASNPGPLIFTWSTSNGNYIGNNFSSILLIDQQGDYSLIIENFLTGCKDTTTINVVKSAFSATAILNKSADINCENSVIDIIAKLSNANGLGMIWSTNDGNILGNPDNDTIQVNKAGTYIFTLSDNSGCSQDYSILVSENLTVPNINPGSDAVLDCDNLTLSLIANVNTPTDDFTLVWTSPGILIADPNKPEIKVNEIGVYILTVTDTINHCTSSDTIEVTESKVPPNLVLNIPGKITCDVDSIKLLAELGNYDPAYTYQWTTTDGLFSGLATDSFIVAKTTGNYMLIVTNPKNGCISDHVFMVEGSIDQPIAHAGSDVILDCTSTSATQSAKYESIDDISNLIFNWTTFDGNINGNINGLNINVLNPGHYIFEVTNIINGCSSLDTFEVFQSNDKPIVNIANIYEITCDSLTQTIIPTWSNAGSDPIISWNTLDGNIVNVLQDSAIILNKSGTYQLKVINNLNGCISIVEVLVGEDIATPSGSILLPEKITCGAMTVPVVFEGSANNYIFKWSTLDGNIISSADQSIIQVSSVGTYSLSVKDPVNGCSMLLSQLVEASSDFPIVDAGSSAILNCKIPQIILQGTVENVTNYNITWQGTNGGNILSGASTLNPIIDQSGTYVLTVINLGNQCIGSDTVNVMKNITEPLFDSPNIINANCFGKNGSISFGSIQNGNGPYIFELNGQVVSSPDLIFDKLEAGDYEIVGKDDNGCSFKYAANIDSDDAISFILPDSVTLEFGQSYDIIPEFLFDTLGMEFDSWIGADYLDCNPCLYPTIKPTYNSTLSLTVRDDHGCPATEDIEIRVVKKQVNVFIPNIFSPGDHNGVNDRITVFTDINSVPKIDEFRIFNRWGAEVFSRNNFIPNDEKEGWDGYYRGKLANPAVYVYFVKCHNVYGEELVFKGGITLIQ